MQFLIIYIASYIGIVGGTWAKRGAYPYQVNLTSFNDFEPIQLF